ncbi:MAG: transcription elongation factor GreA [Patescibacteria group bacterium]
MEKEIYLTPGGLEKLKSELSGIENIKLKEIAQKIADARDLGDLSENAEYHEAKEQQSFLAGRAAELKYKIKHAKIIEKCYKNGVVAVGCAVTLTSDGNEINFEIVGSDESDPSNGKISSDSPIGRALIGSKVGESVKVQTPAGERSYKVVEIK